MAYHPQRAWFEDPALGEPGLRFACTQCGACCSGPSGYVLFTDDEAEAIASTLGLSVPEFIDRYTHDTFEGRSLNEIKTDAGHDCVFLTRDPASGKALCSIYSVRPTQCRTWPFWKRNLATARDWAIAARTCPGIGKGRLAPPAEVRLTRDRSPL